MEAPPPEPEAGKRPWQLWLLALVLAGLAVGAGLRFMLADRGLGSERSAVPGSAPFGAGLSKDTSAIWARLLDALGRQDARRVRVDRVVTLLEEHGHEPAAQAFLADFEREPQLMEVWERYLRSRDTLDASWLARTLGETPAFALLLNRHAQNPDFVRLGEALAGEANAAVEDAASPGATLEAETAAQVAAAEAATRSSQGAPIQGGRLEAFPTGAPVSAPAGGSAAAEPAESGPAPAAPESGGRKQVEQLLADIRDLGRAGAKPDERMLARLKSLRSAGSMTESVTYLAEMFETMPPRDRNKLIDLCLKQSVCDPVAACNQANLYASCVQSCNDNPKCRGRIPPGSDVPAAEEPEPSAPPPTTAASPPPPPSNCSHGKHRHFHRHHDGSRGRDRHCIGVNHHR